MFCTSCGTSQADGATFCFSCGSALGEASAAAPAASNPARAAHPTTAHVHASELPPRAPLYPQRPVGDVTKIKDNFAWVIAGMSFVSLITSVFFVAMHNYFGGPGLLSVAIFGVNIFLVIKDQEQMRREGFGVAYAWGILFPFIYLLIRGSRLGRGSWLAGVWLTAWVLQLFVPSFFALTNGGYYY